MNEYAVICDPGKRRDSAIFMVAKHTGLIVEKATHLGNVERLRSRPGTGPGNNGGTGCRHAWASGS